MRRNQFPRFEPEERLVPDDFRLLEEELLLRAAGVLRLEPEELERTVGVLFWGARGGVFTVGVVRFTGLLEERTTGDVGRLEELPRT